MVYTFDAEIVLTDVVFRTLEEDIPKMKPVVEKMIVDLRKE